MSWTGQQKVSVDRLKTAYILDGVENPELNEDECQEQQESSEDSDEGEIENSEQPLRGKRTIRVPDRLNL